MQTSQHSPACCHSLLHNKFGCRPTHSLTGIKCSSLHGGTTTGDANHTPRSLLHKLLQSLPKAVRNCSDLLLMVLKNLVRGEHCQANRYGELTSIERLRRPPFDCQRYSPRDESIITDAKHFSSHDQRSIYTSKIRPDDSTINAPRYRTTH